MKTYCLLSIVAVAALLMQATFADEPNDKAALGKVLFFDQILSKDTSVSCASCHKPAFAFADTSAVSIGVGGARGTRNTPSAMNVRLQQTFFWDGRAQSLEAQALAPIENEKEMALPIDEAVKRLCGNERYYGLFKKIFNDGPNRTHLSEAIAAFERTLETSNSPFDAWKFSDDSLAMTDAARRGFMVFNGKGKCIQCHFGADFTTNTFRNIGLFDGKNEKDSGRAAITKKQEDVGKFKVGLLRNVAVTAPYMHNGQFNTLKDVIEFYNDTKKIVPGAINRDSLLIKPLGLTAQEKNDLEAFLLSLTDKQFQAASTTLRSKTH